MLNSSFLTRVLILNGDQKLGQIFFLLSFSAQKMSNLLSTLF